MSGRIGDLSPKQQETLSKFRKSVEDILLPNHDDHYLLRWLRARDFDLKKSEQMLRASLAWRKQIGADTILENYKVPEVIEKYFPGGLFGYDKTGSPVWIDPVGTIDLKGVVFSAKKRDVLSSMCHALETLSDLLQHCTIKLGRRIDQCALIFDMEGFGLKHLWKPGVDLYCEILSMFEANYPETLKRTYVVNAPGIFPIAFNLVKPFLSEATRNKIVILGRNWKEEILTDIEADQLPVHWGGTCRDPDGDVHCRSKVCMGGDVPESYYLQGTDLSSEDLVVANVGRGSTLQIDLPVQKEHSAIRWEFTTEDHDIGFGIFRKTCSERQRAGEMEEVYATTRVNSHLVPEDGMITCDQAGTYVIRFDNTYSYMRAKKVMYLIEVLEPDQALSKASSNASFASAEETAESAPAVHMSCSSRS